MKKKSLLIVGAFPNSNCSVFGGIATSCKTLLESKFPSYFNLILIDSTQRCNPPPNIFIRFLLAFKRNFKFIIKLLSEKPDAVLLFVSVGASVIEKGFMAWLARPRRKPVLLFPRGAELINIVRHSRWQRLWIKAAMCGGTHILCQGSTWQRFAVTDLGFSITQTKLIYNWSATDEVLQIGRQKRQRSKLKITKILFLSWLEKEKGVFELLEACLQLRQQHQFRLIIAGRGRAENRAKNFVLKYPELNNCIDFVGWAQGKQKMQLLETADVLALPSWAEGFPNAIIEAMAAKIAVVVSSVGNVPDILKHRKQALVIPPRNVSALTRALHELIVNPQFRWQLAEQGHQYALKRFSTDKEVRKLSVFLKSLIN